MQRLSAGDSSLFDLAIFTPVLLQSMIGETSPTQLPKCGVMFTEEPEGGISQYQEKDSSGVIKTTGITIIQCAYGHNEGVVNSIIPVDTFYVDMNAQIYPVIRLKTYRMVPSSTHARKLELKKNENADLVRAPALGKDAILTLKQFAVLLETFYKKPMDVEFVVKDEEKMVYIVQARPLVHVVDPSQPGPSYLVNPDDISTSDKAQGKVIGAAGGGLRWVSSNNEIIVKPSIAQALEYYQNRQLVPDPKKIHCIVVGKQAPSTSHEATTFRSELKPVIYQEQWKVIESWHEKMVVSPQQALVVLWKDKENSIQELFNNKKAAAGWINYPIPRLVSLSKIFQPNLIFTPEKLKNNLELSDEQYRQFTEQITKAKNIISWNILLTKIKQAPQAEASIALATLLLQLHKLIKEKSKGLTLDEDLRTQTALIEMYALYYAQQIKQVLHYSPLDREYIKRLFPIRFLESMLYQQPEINEIVDGYSATTLIFKELAQEQKITQPAEQKGMEKEPMTIQFLKLSSVAMTKPIENKWNNFVLSLAQLPKNMGGTKDLIAQIVVEINNFDLLPLWLNISFAKSYPGTAKPSSQQVAPIVYKLKKEIDSQKNFLKVLSEKKAIINTLNVNTFEDPKTFNTQWTVFRSDLIDYFKSKSFIDAFNNANDLAKLAALSIMTKFIDVFDVSIKALKGSIQYKTNEKVTLFRTMLMEYENLFKEWAKLVPEGAIIYHEKSPLELYFSIIDQVIEKSKKVLAESQLQSTPRFDVGAFAIGSAAMLETRLTYPQTLEDVFTLIHQCLLVIQKTLSATAGVKDIVRPPLLATIEKELLSVEVEDEWAKEEETNEWPGGIPVVRKPSVLGADIQVNSISLFYNLPLHSHSGQFELTYNKKTESVTLKSRFVGDDKWRWSRIAHFACLFGLINKASMQNIEINDNGTSFELEFTKDSVVQNIKDLVQKWVK